MQELEKSTYLKDEAIELIKEIRDLLRANKEVLTLKEFCVYTGISKNQVYHLTSLRKIPFYRPFGKMIYFKKEEILEFLVANPVLSSNDTNQKSNHFITLKSK